MAFGQLADIARRMQEGRVLVQLSYPDGFGTILTIDEYRALSDDVVGDALVTFMDVGYGVGEA